MPQQEAPPIQFDRTYNIDYYSGSQVSLYIGHIWVDEVTSLSYTVSQNRQPLYGYSDQLYRGLAQGQVLVQGQFSINFKEAGYLWLILNEYHKINTGNNTPLNPFNNVIGEPDSGSTNRKNIEQIINKELTQFELNKIYTELAAEEGGVDAETAGEILTERRFITNASLTGFSSVERSGGGVGTAENIYEAFEDQVWGSNTKRKFEEEEHRRADDVRLNPFDIYITYGDFLGDNSVNHTIRKIVDVSILSTSQQVNSDGVPIQENYTFLARNLV